MRDCSQEIVASCVCNVLLWEMYKLYNKLSNTVASAANKTFHLTTKMLFSQVASRAFAENNFKF